MDNDIVAYEEELETPLRALQREHARLRADYDRLAAWAWRQRVTLVRLRAADVIEVRAHGLMGRDDPTELLDERRLDVAIRDCPLAADPVGG